jgi:hypothetical protein
MNDRELLEAAAKAAGITTGIVNDAFFELREGELYAKWNPLKSDGDALRLAVKLGLEVHTTAFDENYDPSSSCHWSTKDGDLPNATWLDSVYEEHEDHAGDANAATRRAIVRAAAELSKQGA